MIASIPRDVWLVDTTLRDGLQAPGVALSGPEKLRLAIELDATGLPELEAGVAGAGERECAWIRNLSKRPLRTRISCWCRACFEDAEAAARCNAPSVHLSFPISERLLRAFHKDRPWLFQTLQTLSGFAKTHFDYVSIGLQDASRADRGLLADFIDATVAEGASRVRLADSVGILTPAQTASLVAFARRRAPSLDIDFHAHNDLGMATANSVAAVEAGASSVNVTLNGLGERAGNARLEEVAVALSLGLGLFTGIDETRLVPLSRLAAELTHRPLPPDKPISGEMVFAHESGIHGAAQLEDGLAYQPFPASRLGRNTQPLRAGAMAGRHVIQHLLNGQGIHPPLQLCRRFTHYIRQEAGRKNKSFDAHEIQHLWQQFSFASQHPQEPP